MLLTLGFFAAWALIGAGVLAAAQASTESLRVVLTAPAVGMATFVLSLFVFSHAGVALEACALPLTIFLTVASAAVLGLTRPRFAWGGALPVFGVCIGALVISAWPMFTYGFDWIANANDDMANYVLSATQLVHDGLLSPPDAAGLSRDRNYPSVMEALHAFGSRPGADLGLGGFTSVTGLRAYELFMPFIFALNLCAICATAALALQAARQRWAALVAAVLLAISPLATFGVLQQLLAQVAGLGLVTSLAALLMRREVHQRSWPKAGDLIPISILVAAVIVVYIELAAAVGLAYLLYIGILAGRRQLSRRGAACLWIVPVAFTAVVLNRYAVTELRYVGSQTQVGVGGTVEGLFGGPPTFGFSLVPTALPGIVGLQTLPISGNAPFVELSIVGAAIVLTGALALSTLAALRGVAACGILVAFAALAAFLAIKSSDYGLFKLYMYVQPFLAAAAAVGLAKINRRIFLASAFVALALLAAAELSTQQAYVRDSREPLALPDASTRHLLPGFERLAEAVREPIISVTENPTLGKLEAASSVSQPLIFMSQNLFAAFMRAGLARLNGWERRSFVVPAAEGSRVNRFSENTHASAALATRRCTIVLPTGVQTVLNRRFLPERSVDLVSKRCQRLPRNTLVFITSALGQGYYAFRDRRKVAFYPVEPDFFYEGHTMSAFGRYTLLRVLRPSRRFRLRVSLSTTFIHDGSNDLPPAAIIGERRVPLPLIGRGSARIFSAPFGARTIGRGRYLLLDAGREGALLPTERPGLQGLWGRSVPIDPRFVTSFVRDVSLIASERYRRLDRPTAISRFPEALADPTLEYSGIYEDGWTAENSYVVLAGGRPTTLVLRAVVPPATASQRLQVLVNGREVATRYVAPGELELAAPIGASRSARRIEMHWASARPLPAPDRRPVSARVDLLGLTMSDSR